MIDRRMPRGEERGEGVNCQENRHVTVVYTCRPGAVRTDVESERVECWKRVVLGAPGEVGQHR